MRRPARWLFTLCSAMSLLLCVAVCVLWVRSHQVGESASRTSRSETAAKYLKIYSNAGRLAVIEERNYFGPLIPDHQEWLRRFWRVGWRHDASPGIPYDSIWSRPNRSGFAFESSTQPSSFKWGTARHTVFAAAPYWSLAALSGALPVMWLGTGLRGRRWRRRAAMTCVTCGYDLRATPGRCPESL